jgi:hypothetical protein
MRSENATRDTEEVEVEFYFAVTETTMVTATGYVRRIHVHP